MKSQPLISIVVPVFNVKDYVVELAECLLRQTYPNFEVLWIDDWSTDGSLEKLQSFGDKRFRCYKRPHSLLKGGQSCRNYGMDMAKGDYLIIIDSDDLVPDFFVDQRLNAMLSHPEMDMCIFPAYSFHDGGNFEPQEWWGKPTGEDALKSFLRNKFQYAVWTNIYKASFIQEIRWDECVKLHQDLDFNISTLLLHPKMMFVEDARPDYFYRIRQGSVCSKFITNEKHASSMYLFDKIYNRLNLSLKVNEILKACFWEHMQDYRNRLVPEGNWKHRLSFMSLIRNKFSLAKAIYIFFSFLYRIPKYKLHVLIK